jgi:hypothetical protein
MGQTRQVTPRRDHSSLAATGANLAVALLPVEGVLSVLEGVVGIGVLVNWSLSTADLDEER